MLELACAWADAHYLDSGGDEYQPLVRRACAWGGEGTPEVSEYCAAELGALQAYWDGGGAGLDRRRVGSAVSAAPVVGSGADWWGAGLAGPQDRRADPAVVVGGLRRCRSCAQRPWG